MRNTLLAAWLCLGGLALGAAPLFAAGPLERIDDVLRELDRVARRTGDPALGDKVEDVIAKLEDAAEGLEKRPADYQSAAGGIEGAIGDLEAAVKDRWLERRLGFELMDDLLSVTRRLAVEALREADRRGGKPSVLEEADELLSRGDAERAAARRGALAAFKRASGLYKDALSKAESEIG